jgi:N-acetyltransferase 10
MIFFVSSTFKKLKLNLIAFDQVDLSSQMLSAWDVRRLDSYARSMVDWHVITDLIPTITPMILDGHFDRNISFTQAAILVGVGLQRRSIDDLQAELQLDSRQLLANFSKVIIRVVKTLQERSATEAGRSLPAVRVVSNSTVLQPLHVEMAAAAGLHIPACQGLFINCPLTPKLQVL